MKQESIGSPAISVIVPIYNAEKTIRKCVDSLLAQTFQDFEILLIDDGSPDQCGTICDEYAKQDNRVRVIHQENQGVSAARQCGIDHALGNYTIHADPDDWVESRMLEELFMNAIKEGSDMVICDYYLGDNKYVKQKPPSLWHEDVLIGLFRNLHGSCCNKLIKKKCYDDFHISFPLELSFCEDQYVIASILKNDIIITYYPNAFYHYMYNDNSLTRHYDCQSYQKDLLVREMFYTLLSDKAEAQKVAFQSKTLSIVTRAFLLGISFFSNHYFKNEFRNFAPYVKSSSMEPIIKWLTYFSCFGGYHFFNKLFYMGFNVKQGVRRAMRVIKGIK